MARQTSVLQLEGSLGDLCFYKTKHGYLVRRKGSISKSRIQSDPAFARVRENISEFARAARAVKLLRTAFGSLLQRAADKAVTGRLMSRMIKVIKTDPVNPHGQRTVHDGQPLLLEGFEFNHHSALTTALRANFTASIDRAKGRMIIDIPVFSPATMISFPEGATHFRLFSGGAGIDFEQNTYNEATSESAYLPISRKRVGPIQLIQKVKARSSGSWFLLLGIEFVQLVNGKQTPLRNGGFNALAIVRAVISNR